MLSDHANNDIQRPITIIPFDTIPSIAYTDNVRNDNNNERSNTMNLETILSEMGTKLATNYVNAVYVVVLLPIVWHAGFAMGLIKRGR